MPTTGSESEWRITLACGKLMQRPVIIERPWCRRLVLRILAVSRVVKAGSRRSAVPSRVFPSVALALYNTKYQFGMFNGCGIMLRASISTNAESRSMARTRASCPAGAPHLHDDGIS